MLLIHTIKDVLLSRRTFVIFTLGFIIGQIAPILNIKNPEYGIYIWILISSMFFLWGVGLGNSDPDPDHFCISLLSDPSSLSKTNSFINSEVNSVTILNNHPPQIISGSHDGAIRIWDFNGQLISHLECLNSPITVLILSTCHHKIISGCQDGNCDVWSIHSGKHINSFHNKHKSCILSLMSTNYEMTNHQSNGHHKNNSSNKLSVKGSNSSILTEVVVSCSENGLVFMWNLETTQVLKRFDLFKKPYPSASQSSLLLSSSSSSLSLSRSPSRNQLTRQSSSSTLLSHNNANNTSHSHSQQQQHQHHTNTNATPTYSKPWTVATAAVAAACKKSKHLSCIALGSHSGDIHLYHVEKKDIFDDNHNTASTNIMRNFSMDENNDGGVSYFDNNPYCNKKNKSSKSNKLHFPSSPSSSSKGNHNNNSHSNSNNNMKMMSRMVLKGHFDKICALSVYNDVGVPLLVSASGDWSTRVWNTITGDCYHVLNGHSGPVEAVSLYYDSNPLIITAGRDATVRVWDLRLGVLYNTLESDAADVHAIAISKGSLLHHRRSRTLSMTLQKIQLQAQQSAKNNSNNNNSFFSKLHEYVNDYFADIINPFSSYDYTHTNMTNNNNNENIDQTDETDEKMNKKDINDSSSYTTNSDNKNGYYNFYTDGNNNDNNNSNDQMDGNSPTIAAESSSSMLSPRGTQLATERPLIVSCESESCMRLWDLDRILRDVKWKRRKHFATVISLLKKYHNQKDSYYFRNVMNANNNNRLRRNNTSGFLLWTNANTPSGKNSMNNNNNCNKSSKSSYDAAGTSSGKDYYIQSNINSSKSVNYDVDVKSSINNNQCLCRFYCNCSSSSSNNNATIDKKGLQQVAVAALVHPLTPTLNNDTTTDNKSNNTISIDTTTTLNDINTSSSTTPPRFQLNLNAFSPIEVRKMNTNTNNNAGSDVIDGNSSKNGSNQNARITPTTTSASTTLTPTTINSTTTDVLQLTPMNTPTTTTSPSLISVFLNDELHCMIASYI